MIRPLWIEVDLGALRNNLKKIRLILGDNVTIIATIKQSAYGHGLIPVAKELMAQGIDFFGVGSIEEASSLRKEGFGGSIIVLSAVLDKFVSYFLEHEVIPTVVDLGFAKKLNKEAAKANKVIPVHVKIDTGMGRLGMHYKQAHTFIKQLKELSNISLEGIYTHFPVADSDSEFTNFQIDIFNGFVSQLNKEGIFFKFCHCANSIGIMNYPRAHFNMVRPGLILYGINPCLEFDLDLEPVLSLKSKVIFVKNIAKGMSVSYGRTYVAKGASNIATVSVGYADGYPWILSNRSQVIIGNDFYDVAGRVCMDHIMVDLKNTENIKAGQEVILIGKGKNIEITAQDLASWADTIPYEIVSRLSLKIPRVYKSATAS